MANQMTTRTAKGKCDLCSEEAEYVFGDFGSEYPCISCGARPIDITEIKNEQIFIGKSNFTYTRRAQFAQCEKCLFIYEYYFIENLDYEWESMERCKHCFADRKELRKVTVVLK